MSVYSKRSLSATQRRLHVIHLFHPRHVTRSLVKKRAESEPRAGVRVRPSLWTAHILCVRARLCTRVSHRYGRDDIACVYGISVTLSAGRGATNATLARILSSQGTTKIVTGFPLHLLDLYHHVIEQKYNKKVRLVVEHAVYMGGSADRCVLLCNDGLMIMGAKFRRNSFKDLLHCDSSLRFLCVDLYLLQDAVQVSIR